MPVKKIVNLQCDVCATEIVVSTSGEYRLEPIYCCGLEVVEMKPGSKQKKSAGKAVKDKKTLRKKTAKGKKKAVLKRRASQKDVAKGKPQAKKSVKKKKAVKKASRRK